MRVLLVASLVLSLSACGAEPKMVPGTSPAPTSAAPAAPVALAVAPAKDTQDLPISAEQVSELQPDALILRIQPDEGITLRFGAKVPGHSFMVRSASMEFSYQETFKEESPEAYERLLLDALMGDPTLFIRTDEVEQCWRIVDPIIDRWANDNSPIPTYEAASWGPTDADRLIGRSGRKWRNVV